MRVKVGIRISMRVKVGIRISTRGTIFEVQRSFDLRVRVSTSENTRGTILEGSMGSIVWVKVREVTQMLTRVTATEEASAATTRATQAAVMVTEQHKQQ